MGQCTNQPVTWLGPSLGFVRIFRRFGDVTCLSAFPVTSKIFILFLESSWRHYLVLKYRDEVWEALGNKEMMGGRELEGKRGKDFKGDFSVV